MDFLFRLVKMSVYVIFLSVLWKLTSFEVVVIVALVGLQLDLDDVKDVRIKIEEELITIIKDKPDDFEERVDDRHTP